MGACGASSRDELKQKEGSPVLPDLSFELAIRSGLEHMPTWISPVRHLLQKCHFSETDLSAKSRPEEPHTALWLLSFSNQSVQMFWPFF